MLKKNEMAVARVNNNLKSTEEKIMDYTIDAGLAILPELRLLKGAKYLIRGERAVSKLKPVPLENLSKGEFALPKSKMFSPDATDKLIKEKALSYQKLTQDPRYLERARNLDKEFGTDFERKLELFKQQGDKPQNIVTRQEDYFPFNITRRKELANPDALGVSERSLEGKFKLLNKLKTESGSSKFSPNDRQVGILDAVTNPDQVERIIQHELKHHWTDVLKNNVKYQDELSRGVVSESANTVLPRKDFHYLTDPTEIDAYLHTNLRNDLVNQGYLKDHFDTLTKDNLTDFITKNRDSKLVQRYFKPGQELVYDKNQFINTFNKSLPVLAPVGLGSLLYSYNKKPKPKA